MADRFNIAIRRRLWSDGVAVGWSFQILPCGVNFFERDASNGPVIFSVKKREQQKKSPREPEKAMKGGARTFSFATRRYASSGPRRLFIPQKPLMSPVFEPDVQRPKAILRVVSSCA
jgi:hypothetical protein